MVSISEPFIRRPVGTTLLAIGLFLVGFVAWRLADGHPVHLGFLVPYFERSLDAPDHAFKVELAQRVALRALQTAGARL